MKGGHIKIKSKYFALAKFTIFCNLVKIVPNENATKEYGMTTHELSVHQFF